VIFYLLVEQEKKELFMEEETSPFENTYPTLHPSDEVELTRMLVQHRRLREEMGGLLPRQVDPAHMHAALDAACGPGAWALDLAREYPHLHVIAIDHNQLFIDYARALAWETKQRNLRYLVQDMNNLDSTLFRPNMFDLINIAFISECILTTDYQALAQSLARLCAPGGWMCWTELATFSTNSPSFERLMTLLSVALKAAGHPFFVPASIRQLALLQPQRFQDFPADRYIGISHMLGYWLQHAGCRSPQYNAHAIEVSTGRPAHYCFVRQAWVFAQQIRSFLLRHNAISGPAFEQLFAAMEREVQQEHFCGVCFVVTAIAEKVGM
jgi:ubiquinone/menaquinone biosynthesis C-methylase UbiE